MTITACASFVQIPGNGSATVFAAPMKCFQASDVVVSFIANGIAAAQTSGYTVSNVDVNGGFTVTFATPPPSTVLVDIRTRTPLTQSTEFANLGQYLPENTTEAFDRAMRALQDAYRQTYQFGVHGPDSENTQWPALPAAALRAGSVLAFDANGLPTIGVPTTQVITTALLAGFLGTSQTAAEAIAGVVPFNMLYQPLDPRRYGAVFDGVTDDTISHNQWVSVVNASANPVANWPIGKTTLSGPLNVITAANLTWNAYSTIVSNPAGGTGAQVSVSGAGLRLRGLNINGNQFAFAGSTNFGLSITGNSPILENVNISACGGWGLTVDTVDGGSMVNCIVQGNAAFGAYFNTVSNMSLVGCLFTGNGYGFKATSPVPNAGGGFNFTMRFRSHHNTLTGCESVLGGLDGFNVNQGSYAIKFIGCKAWQNGDGGFTIAADNAGTGRTGEGEYCYDLEYAECEAYNNWASGLVCETIVYNLAIVGGRYYNNGRYAGTLAMISSVPNGIYVGNGSQGVTISKVKCYDDRQLCPITAATSGGATLSATGWGSTAKWGTGFTPPPFAATAAAYPRVALYNANYAFEGYANILSEGAGTLTIASSAANGVTLSSIASGWFVSQRTQHNGVYFDIGSQGVVDADCWGHLPGINTQYGYKVYAYPSNGSNVINKAASKASTELLANPSWDSSATTGWTYSGSGSAGAYSTAGPNLHSGGAVQLTSTGGGATYIGQGALIAGGANFCQDGWLEAVCTVTSVAPGASISVINAGVYTTTVNHPGGGTRQLKIGMMMPAGSSPILEIAVTNGASAYFDEASLSMHFEPFDNRDFAWPTRNLAV